MLNVGSKNKSPAPTGIQTHDLLIDGLFPAPQPLPWKQTKLAPEPKKKKFVMVINLDSVNATLSNVSFKRILIRYNQEDPPTPSGGI